MHALENKLLFEERLDDVYEIAKNLKGVFKKD